MAVVRSIGPRLTQLIIYVDATYGNIAAIITAISTTDGSISLTTFPPGGAPQNQTSVNYDYKGTIVGSWHYHETDVI